MDETRKKFLEELNKKRKIFEETLNRLIETQRAYDGNHTEDQFTDESDHAQREISASSNYRLIERKSRELKQIDRLIQKLLNNENFGVCEECGKQIPAERLLIVPETSLCVKCQRELEKMDQLRSMRERQPSGYGIRLDADLDSADEFSLEDYEKMGDDLDILSIGDTDTIVDAGPDKLD